MFTASVPSPVSMNGQHTVRAALEKTWRDDGQGCLGATVFSEQKQDRRTQTSRRQRRHFTAVLYYVQHSSDALDLLPEPHPCFALFFFFFPAARNKEDIVTRSEAKKKKRKARYLTPHWRHACVHVPRIYQRAKAHRQPIAFELLVGGDELAPRLVRATRSPFLTRMGDEGQHCIRAQKVV